MLGNFFKTY